MWLVENYICQFLFFFTLAFLKRFSGKINNYILFIMDCKNCGATLTGPFCSECGQKLIDERITVRYLFKSLISIITNVDKGFLYTIKMMFANPAGVIRDVLNGKTVNYYHPLRYAIIWTALSVFLLFSLNVMDNSTAEINERVLDNPSEKALEFQRQFMELYKRAANILILFMIPFVAFFARRFFRKGKLNFAEHMVAYSYIMGHASMLGIFTFGLYYFLPNHFELIPLMGILVAVSYMTYVYKNLFEMKGFTAAFRSLLTYLLGYLCFMLFVFVLGMITALFYLFVIKGGNI